MLSGLKPGNFRSEQMSSGLPPKADLRSAQLGGGEAPSGANARGRDGEGSSNFGAYEEILLGCNVFLRARECAPSIEPWGSEMARLPREVTERAERHHTSSSEPCPERMKRHVS